MDQDNKVQAYMTALIGNPKFFDWVIDRYGNSGTFTAGQLATAIKNVQTCLEEKFPIDSPPNNTIDKGTTDERVYPNPIANYVDEIISVEDWLKYVEAGYYNHYDGTGYWCKDDMQSLNSVWISESLDATHVAWYGK